MTSWNDRNGLPSDTVLDVIQDRDGYIWLATYEGLIRFDGESFSIMDEENGFDGRSARVLELSSSGDLWVGTNTAGLYLHRKGHFTHYGKEQGLPNLSVRALTFGPKGELYVGTAGGIARLTPGTEQLIPVAGASSNEIGISNFLLQMGDGSILVGSNLNGLWQINENGVRPFLPDAALREGSFASAYIDPKGRLWLGASQGTIFRIERNEIAMKLSPEMLAGSSINEFFMDPEGTLWIATDKGILYYQNEKIQAYTEEQGLPSNVVSSLWQDREGSLWVGTERGGLVKFSPGKFINIDKKSGLTGDAVNAVTEDAYGSLWVGGDDGLSFLPSPEDPWNTDTVRRKSVNRLLKELTSVRVRQVRSESDGSIWISTYSDHALITLFPDGSISYMNKNSGLPINRIRFSYRAPSGALWIGTTAGPVRVKEGKLTAFKAEDGLVNLFTLCATEDRTGKTWLGTDGSGVSCLEGDRFTTFTTANGLAGNVVFRILEDRVGRIWFCTSEGLSMYANGAFATVTRESGISRDSVFEILESPEGQLWIIFGRRIVVVSANALANWLQNPSAPHREMPTIRAYDRLDGLAGQLTSNGWAYMSKRSIVHLPTLRGVSTYNPQSVSTNNLPPPVFIETVSIDTKTTPVQQDSPAITLPAGTRRLTIRYAALSYMIPQRVHFRYMLEGYDQRWILAGTSREIAYTNLPPGKYTFRVRAENNDGVLNEKGGSIAIVQRPFFYQTTIFLIAMIGGLVALIGLAAMIRLRQLERRREELEYIVEVRTNELVKEKGKSDALLLNVLPPAIADELKQSGKVEPKVYSDVSILFGDLVGFTSRSSSMSPEETIRDLNEIFSAFDDILESHGCERIKTLGDGYLASCGLPISIEDHARRLTTAAVDMLRWLDSYNQGRNQPWAIRMGIHCGPVVAGIVGIKKYIFDVFGDTVNTTFRLQTLSPPMGITISNEVAGRIGSLFNLIPRINREIKGKGELATWFIRWKATGPVPASESCEDIAAIYQNAKLLFDSGKARPAKEVLEKIDYCCCEPDLGKEVLTLLGYSYKALGDESAARGAWELAEEFCR